MIFVKKYGKLLLVIAACVSAIVASLTFIVNQLEEKPDLEIVAYTGHFEYPKLFMQRLDFIQPYSSNYFAHTEIEKYKTSDGDFLDDSEISLLKEFLSSKHQKVFAEPYNKGMRGINSFAYFHIRNKGDFEARKTFIKGLPSKGIIEVRDDEFNRKNEKITNSQYVYEEEISGGDSIEITFFFEEQLWDLDFSSLIAGHDGKSVKILMDEHVDSDKAFIAKYGLLIILIQTIFLIGAYYFIFIICKD